MSDLRALPIPPLEATALGLIVSCTPWTRAAVPTPPANAPAKTASGACGSTDELVEVVSAAVTEPSPASPDVMTLPRAHDALRAHADAMHRAGRGWLIDWWTREMYTAWRAPLPSNVSYWYSLQPSLVQGSQATVAATLCVALSRWRDALVDGRLAPEVAEGARLDPSMFRYVLHACRLPRIEDDGVRVYDGERDTAPSNVVAVLRRGVAFAVHLDSVRGDGSVQRASIDELAARFQLVAQLADRDAAAAGIAAAACAQPPVNVAVGTSGHRDVWAPAFQTIFGAPASARLSHDVGVAACPDADARLMRAASLTPAQRDNLQSLTTLEAAMCVVCLDDVSPMDVASRSRNLLDGSVYNRWFDKCAQLVVTANGGAGFIGEHSRSDGMPTARMMEWVCRHIATGDVRKPCTLESSTVFLKEAGIPRGNRIVCTPQQDACIAALRMSAPSDALPGLQQCASDILAQAQGHDLIPLMWSTYGREEIKQWRVSPDAWAQMAMQLAYYRWRGRFDGTYEPAHTRRFLHGRTACIRVVSTASCEWARHVDAALVAAPVDTHSSARVSPGRAARVASLLHPAAAAGLHEQLQRAGDKHVLTSRRAGAGLDVDRHLLGLQLMVRDVEARARAEGKPFKRSAALEAFFALPVLRTSKSWYLSTSNLSVPYFENWGWGEVLPGGIGVAYSVQAHAMTFNIVGEASTRIAGFVAHLAHALQDMRTIAELALAQRHMETAKL